MSASDVPPWIDVAEGTAPILLFAPHGGRRHDVRVPGTHKVNDLWTADVTRALAAICGATTIVNATMDRNVVDLNRLSQVGRDAPWLLVLLRDVLTRILLRFGHATVLVMHGWNVSQPVCDVGIGAREDGGEIVPCRPGAQTASPEFVAERVRPFQARAAAEGFTVTIGSRYPAAHPNNLLQMFGAMHEALDDGTLRASGRIDAAQIELAIPLRWPGPRRDRLIGLLADTLASAGRPSAPALPPPPPPRAIGGRVTGRRGLQFVAGEMLVMASIEASDGGPIGGRLVVSRDAERLALFTGELALPGEPWCVPPLSIATGPGGEMHVRFDGPMVAFPSHTPFVDLERGLAGGTVMEGRLDVTFRPEAGASACDADEVFGDVDGELVVDGRRTAIATRGVALTGLPAGARSLPSCRLTLPSSPWGTVALMTAAADPLRAEGAHWIGTLHGGATLLDARAPVRVDGALCLDGATSSLTLHASGERSLEGRVERLIPVRRPGREGTVVETTFALLRVAGTCVGWLEVTMLSAG